MPSIKKFTGINNVAKIAASAGSGDLQTAMNVYIDNSGVIHRRTGFDAYEAGDIRSMNGDTGSLIYVKDEELYKWASPAPTLITGSLTADRTMAYLYLNGLLYFSNGYQSGVYQNSVARTWGITAPAAPVSFAADGDLTKGMYQVSLTYMRADGQESGTSAPILCDGRKGGIRLVGITASSNTGVIAIVVYMTPVGGEVGIDGGGLYKHTILPNASTSITITDFGMAGAGMECKTFNTAPPPVSTAIAFYRGRLYLASGNTMWETLPWMYENVSLRFGGTTFPSAITNILPVKDGLWVTTATEFMFLSAKDPKEGGGWTINSRTPTACAAGGVVVSSRLTGARELSPGDQAMWVTADGVFMGDDTGKFINRTGTRWVPASTAGVFGVVINETGAEQYVFGLGSPSIVHTMNINTGAVTKYDNAFVSVASVGSTVYGSKSTGIFAGGNPDDGGVAIAAQIEKSGISFGERKIKSFPEMYLYMSSAGVVNVTVTSGVSSGSSETETPVGVGMRGHKVHLPRGIRGRDFTINIANVAGADFTLAEIEMDAATSVVRSGRQDRG